MVRHDSQQEGVHDFHTHTFLSDGELSPVELIRRAMMRGYKSIAIADHAGPGTMEQAIAAAVRDCALARQHWGIQALPGVELTHLPPAAIAEAAAAARKLGARIIVVHGESPVEPVEEGTNLAAVQCPEVDILAHPGCLSAEVAALAAANGIFLEITARQGHCLCNGLVARVAQQTGARLLVNSDTHEPKDLLTPEMAEKVALGAGLSADEARVVLQENPRRLLERAEAR